MKAVLVSILKRATLLVALLCLGCAAQTSTPSEISSRIEKQLRQEAELSPLAVVKVGPRAPSEFGGWDQVIVAVDDQGEQKTYTFLLSRDGKSLVHYNKFDLSQDPNQKVMSKIDLTGRPVRGNKDAKVTVAIFDDFQCPYCAHMYDTLFNEVMKRYSDRIKVIYKDYPLYQIHDWSVKAAVDANCLLDQSGDAYWQYSDVVRANREQIAQQEAEPEAKPAKESKATAKDAKDKDAKPAHEMKNTGLDKVAADVVAKDSLDAGKLRACIEKHDVERIRTSILEGQKLGINATPTLFVNGEKLEGALTPEELGAALDRALAEAGVPVPAKPAPATPAAPKPGSNPTGK